MTDTSDEDEIEIEIERAERIDSDSDRASDDSDWRDRLRDDPDWRDRDDEHEDVAETNRATNVDRTRPNGASSAGGPTEYSEYTESDPERRLEDELGRIGVSTTSEGYVEGRVTGLESVDETTVRLEVSLPHGGTVDFPLEKPIPWSDEFLLARIVEDVGYDAASISHLIGERVYLARTDLEPATTGSGDTDSWDAWGSKWLDEPTKSIGDAVLASLGSQFRLDDRQRPEWRLVDPRERRATEDDSRVLPSAAVFGTLLIVLAPLVVAFGVAYGVAGGLTVSGPVIGFALLGMLLAFLGASVLLTGEE